MSRNILITGGAGFIGCNAAQYFIAQGDTVTLLDNFSRRGVQKNVDWLLANRSGRCNVLKADVRTDVAALEQAIQSADAVIHLAAQVAVTTSVADPVTDFDINLRGTLNILEAIRKSRNHPPLLFSSTNKVYGDLEQLGIDELPTRYVLHDKPNGIAEDQALDFHSPYGCSKGGADQYVRDYSRIYGLKTVVFRQSCIYGPRQLGIEDQGWVAWFIIAGLMGRPVTLYGNGKQVRDLLFVDDLVGLYARAIASIERVCGKVYNVGGGPSNTLSLAEFCQLLEQKYGIRFQSTTADVRPGDQKVFVSDNRSIQNDIGWQPTTGIASGIGLLTEWLKTNLGEIRELY